MSAKVLVIGSGAREQCLAWSLSKSACIELVYVYPGNGGVDFLGSKKVSIPDNSPIIDDFHLLGKWCLEEEIQLVVVGPEIPLVNGIVDALTKQGVPCFGPQSSAAVIEGSKAFAKEFMVRYCIPTARYKCFTDIESACEHIHSAPYNATVIKASGLAAGKGVIVSENQEEACSAVNQILKDKKFGEAGRKIIVEEHLEGEEVSVLCFSDGKHISIMPLAQDHKRLLDGDVGPNTGGMGAYCPCPQVSEEMLDFISQEILTKAIAGLEKEGRPYVGVLYAGLMLTNEGPKVLEFNCRFGDPECQVILPLLESDLYEVMQACVNGGLDSIALKWKENTSAVGIVMASGGYPGTYEKGKKITGISHASDSKNVNVFHAGTKLNKNGEIVTSGGRVLTVVALGATLEVAHRLASSYVNLVKFEASYHRSDIARRGIAYENRERLTYAGSGVDVAAGDQFVQKISPIAKLTNRKGCLSSIGGFGGSFDLKQAGYTNPVLVAGTDGVGTKLIIANACRRHLSIGVDLVAMCANDVLTHNAEPLFFLDYYACGKLSANVASEVLQGIADGCVAAGCALIGGETAEMPGMYQENSYDLGGFVVGAYDKERDVPLPRIDDVDVDDVIIGIASTGLHSNGFSLVRKIVEKSAVSLDEPAPFDVNKTLGNCLLTPTAIYCKQLLPVLRSELGVKALAHITGGGIVGNLPRVLPDHLGAELDAKSWKVPAVFGWIYKEGDLEIDEMLRTFNCGLGMCLIANRRDADTVLDRCNAALSSINLKAYNVGRIVQKPNQQQKVVVYSLKEALNRAYRKNINIDRPTDIKINTPREKTCKRNVAVIISGSGTNLQALIDFTKSSSCSYHIKLVVSNKPSAYGLVRARKHGITTKIVSNKAYDSREAFDRAIHDELVNHEIDFVCLAGFMRLLSGWFVSKWRGRLINIHPSLLPLFKGLNPHKQALDAGVRVSGCTVHYVVEEVDAGAILGQEAVAVHPSDDVESLQERIKLSEHLLYPRVLDLVCKGEAALSGCENKVMWKIS